MLAGFWHKVPFARIVIPVVAGVGIDMFYPLHPVVIVPALLLVLACNLCLYYWLKNPLQNWIKGIAVNLLCFVFGFALHQSHYHLNYNGHFSKHSATHFIIRLQEQPLKRARSFKVKAEVICCIDTTGKQHTSDGLLLLYFDKDSALFARLKYGDVLLVPNTANEIPPPQNPDEFDYKRYLAFNQVFYQAYLPADHLQVLQTTTGNPLWHFAYSVQRYFNGVLDKYVQSKKEIAVAQALLFGYDDDIDADLVKAYSNTGTLHVLAVSGMHVGLIFGLINLLLRYLDKRQYQRIIKVLLSLFSIWIYSLICGLSPSILRASVMFSLVAVGQSMKHKPDIYNTLSASALLLLLFNSNMLSNVGFQLSFLAVVGIVSLQRYFNEWFYFNSGFMNEVWTIVSVSIAAQLATFPLGLLYFHQFPVYFPASNLFIIPLTMLIIFATISLMAMSGMVLFLPFMFRFAAILGQIIKWLIAFTNTLVIWLERLPGSYINGAHVSIAETIFIYLLVTLLIAFLVLRKKEYFRYALLAACLIVLINIAESVRIARQNFMVVYHIKKHTALAVVTGNHARLIADTALLNDDYKFHFHLQQHIWASGIKRVDTIPFTGNIEVRVGDKKIIIGKLPVAECDYWVNTGNFSPNSTGNRVKELIILNYNGTKSIPYLNAGPVNASGRVYDLAKNGAFVVSLNDF